MKHKKDAIEWGVIGGDQAPVDETTLGHGDKGRDKSGLSLLKDKTGLGLGWGRTFATEAFIWVIAVRSWISEMLP